MPDTAQLQEKVSVVFDTFTIDLPGGFIMQPNYLQAGLIVFLVFLLVLTLGQLRHRMNSWTLKGTMPGIGFGFAIALILEGFLLIGGRTLFTEVLGWENAPKPISNVLDTGRERLVDVLGVTDPIPNSNASEASSEGVVLQYQSLTSKEASSVRELICQ